MLGTINNQNAAWVCERILLYILLVTQSPSFKDEMTNCAGCTGTFLSVLWEKFRFRLCGGLRGGVHGGMHRGSSLGVQRGKVRVLCN